MLTFHLAPRLRPAALTYSRTARRREPLPRPARLSLTLGPAHRVLPPRACARSRVRERACARERANKPQTRIDQSKALVGPSVFDLLFGVGFQRPMKSSRCAAKQAPPTNEIAWSIRHFEFSGVESRFSSTRHHSLKNLRSRQTLFYFSHHHHDSHGPTTKHQR